MACSDGGAESGKYLTPLFQDRIRPQVVVNLLESGGPVQMALGKMTPEEYVALVARGQDEAIEFLRGGTVKRQPRAITLFPRGADVSKNVCVAK